MSKRPTDGDEPAAKKRGSGRQLTKDDVSDDEVEEKGSIETATDEVMKGRRVLKARRAGGVTPAPTPAAGAPAAPAAANPFSGVSLTAGAGASGGGNGFAALAATKPEEPAKPAEGAAPETGGAEPSKAEAEAPAAAAEAKPAEEKSEAAPAQTFASFAAGAAPFAATAGSRPAFNFGTAAASGDGEGNGSAKPGPFSFSGAAGGTPGVFSFKPPEGGFPSVQSIFGSGAPSDQQTAGGEEEGGRGIKPALAQLPPEAEQKTGEEGEQTVWAGEGTLYEFSAERQWRERGRGELRINKGTSEGEGARFVMRQKGYLRLLMNARLWPDMKVSRMDGGKGATFPVVNAVPGPEDKPDEERRLKTFAFRLKSAGQLDAFIAAADAHKAAGAAAAEASAAAAKAEEAKS